MGEPLRIAYADPPYVGQAKKLYKSEEVDHAQLAVSLRDFDGWALSASSPSLHVVLPLFPGARIGAWVKPFAIFKPGVNPAYAWEPVLYKPARSGKDREGGRKAPTVRDWHSCNITLKRGLCGAKPASFCAWLFDLLGMEPRDDFTDMFPGTGAVTTAWDKWRLERRGCRISLATSAPRGPGGR